MHDLNTMLKEIKVGTVFFQPADEIGEQLLDMNGAVGNKRHTDQCRTAGIVEIDLRCTHGKFTLKAADQAFQSTPFIF